jgi:hypothetical protein
MSHFRCFTEIRSVYSTNWVSSFATSESSIHFIVSFLCKLKKKKLIARRVEGEQIVSNRHWTVTSTSRPVRRRSVLHRFRYASHVRPDVGRLDQAKLEKTLGSWDHSIIIFKNYTNTHTYIHTYSLSPRWLKTELESVKSQQKMWIPFPPTQKQTCMAHSIRAMRTTKTQFVQENIFHSHVQRVVSRDTL